MDARMLRTFIIAACCLATGSYAVRGDTPQTDSVAGIATRTSHLPAPLSISVATRESTSPLNWYDAHLLTIEGIGFKDVGTSFSRLPVRALDKVSSDVRTLSRHTAGICIRFATDSTTISAIWNGGEGMYHMAPTGSNGLDLYVHRPRSSRVVTTETPTLPNVGVHIFEEESASALSDWVFVGVGRPKRERTMAQLTNSQSGGIQEYLLYLPLYAPVSELKIGVASGAFISPVLKRPVDARPLVFYGTSITQGGCASRAGMCHTALLGRWLDREVINLGFSGSGKSEPIMAQLVSEIDACAYVVEPLPNMTLTMTNERIVPFVKILRERHPQTPILLVENPLFPGNAAQNTALRKAISTLERDGVKGLYRLPAEPQLAGPENATVDGVHPTDLGFMRMAQAYFPVLKGILGVH